jgi:hypothetical protein
MGMEIRLLPSEKNSDWKVFKNEVLRTIFERQREGITEFVLLAKCY